MAAIPLEPSPEPVILSTLFDDVREVRRLELRPGDIIILRVEGPLTHDAADRLKELAMRQFTGHKVVILANGLDIGVVGPGEESVPPTTVEEDEPEEPTGGFPRPSGWT